MVVIVVGGLQGWMKPGSCLQHEPFPSSRHLPSLASCHREVGQQQGSRGRQIIRAEAESGAVAAGGCQNSVSKVHGNLHCRFRNFLYSGMASQNSYGMSISWGHVCECPYQKSLAIWGLQQGPSFLETPLGSSFRPFKLRLFKFPVYLRRLQQDFYKSHNRNPFALNARREIHTAPPSPFKQTLS